ncbi:MAG: hypothetical protein AAGJ35_16260, partial [Myxococcota bacterium]
GHEGDDIPEEGARFEVMGSSLLEVLHEWMLDHHRMIQAQYNSPRNRGCGSLDEQDVEDAAEQLRLVEAMQAELAAQNRRKEVEQQQRLEFEKLLFSP